MNSPDDLAWCSRSFLGKFGLKLTLTQHALVSNASSKKEDHLQSNHHKRHETIHIRHGPPNEPIPTYHPAHRLALYSYLGATKSDSWSANFLCFQNRGNLMRSAGNDGTDAELVLVAMQNTSVQDSYFNCCTRSCNDLHYIYIYIYCLFCIED